MSHTNATGVESPQAVRRISTETKASVKTTELIAYVVVISRIHVFSSCSEWVCHQEPIAVANEGPRATEEIDSRSQPFTSA